MTHSRWPVLCYFLLLTMGVLHWISVYPRLPDRMASHFAANGTPNGWQPKPAFFTLSIIVVCASALVAFVSPRFMKTRSDERINLPHKSYWLAPERREETFRFFRVLMNWFGCGLLVVLLTGMSLAINANLPIVHNFDSTTMWYVIGGFVFFVAALIAATLRHFYNVPPGRSPSTPGAVEK